MYDKIQFVDLVNQNETYLIITYNEVWLKSDTLCSSVIICLATTN